MLVLVSAALARGQRKGRAIGQWVREQREELAPPLGRIGRPLPTVVEAELAAIEA